jgi:hypothetical protein
MGLLNVNLRCAIGTGLMDWALIAYRKHQKTYAKDVKRELARLWVLKGGD